MKLCNGKLANERNKQEARTLNIFARIIKEHQNKKKNKREEIEEKVVNLTVNLCANLLLMYYSTWRALFHYHRIWFIVPLLGHWNAHRNGWRWDFLACAFWEVFAWNIFIALSFSHSMGAFGKAGWNGGHLSWAKYENGSNHRINFIGLKERNALVFQVHTQCHCHARYEKLHARRATKTAVRSRLFVCSCKWNRHNSWHKYINHLSR